MAFSRVVNAAAAKRGFEFIHENRHATLATHLRQLLSALAVDVVLDVGSHKGEYRNLLHSVGYDGQIVSFDPIGDADHHIALGDSDGSATFNVAAETSLSSFYQPVLDVPDAVAVEHKEVPLRRLDSIWDELVPSGRVFLKIDTQGFDLRVLQGAGDRLKDCVGVQFEVGLDRLYDGTPSFEEIIAWVRKRGFAITGLFPVGRNLDLTIHEMDCVARQR